MYSREIILELDIFNLTSSSSSSAPLGGVGGTGSDKKRIAHAPGGRRAGAGGGLDSEDDEDAEDLSPLFWQPGKRGYYAPRAGKPSPERVSAYRNVGR